MTEENADYTMQKHIAKRDKEFEELKQACDMQKSLEPLRLRFNTLFEELAESKGKAEKRKKQLKNAEQKYNNLENKYATTVALQSKPKKDATTLDLPFKLDVIQGARKTNDILIIGDKQCIFFQHYFTLGDKLGKGGFGTVYTATALPNNRQHALKIISKSKFAEKADNKRCVENEVRIQMKLEHENILSLQYCVQDEDSVYLLMEYCAENSILKYINQKPDKILPVMEAMLLVSQLLDALVYLHERQIIHRDIKPSNLLLAGKIKLADFGLAIDCSIEPPVACIKGTVPFCAPEVIALELPHDYKSDIWSTGCTLYQMVTGRLPLPYKKEEDKLFRRKMSSRRGLSSS